MKITSEHYMQAKRDFVELMRGGASPLECALFIANKPLVIHGSLSREVEDVAFPGTFAERIFDLLCLSHNTDSAGVVIGFSD